MKVLVGAFNQEKALVGTFSGIVKTDESFAALDTADLRRDAVTLIKWRHIML